MAERPCAVSQAIAELVPALPDQAARDLRALLIIGTALQAPAVKRTERLGLLLRLLDGEGTIPDSASYALAREKCAEAGEHWPDHSTLCRAYGSWLLAVKAAMALLHGLGRPPSYKRPGTSVSYTLIEVIEAVRACRQALGPWPSEDDWPTESEYLAYRRFAREAAARAGMPSPRLPCRQTIRTKVGRWDQVLAQARVERHAA